jgi:hypothetical protein
MQNDVVFRIERLEFANGVCLTSHDVDRIDHPIDEKGKKGNIHRLANINSKTKVTGKRYPQRKKVSTKLNLGTSHDSTDATTAKIRKKRQFNIHVDLRLILTASHPVEMRQPNQRTWQVNRSGCSFWKKKPPDPPDES